MRWGLFLILLIAQVARAASSNSDDAVRASAVWSGASSLAIPEVQPQTRSVIGELPEAAVSFEIEGSRALAGIQRCAAALQSDPRELRVHGVIRARSLGSPRRASGLEAGSPQIQHTIGRRRLADDAVRHSVNGVSRSPCVSTGPPAVEIPN